MTVGTIATSLPFTKPFKSPSKLRLAAIDLDGTLLGPDSKISAENRSAVGQLAAAGLEVVLASGRHYRSMLPYARQLPEVKWIVSSQGAEVGRADRSQILARNFLRKSDVRVLMEAETTRGFSAVYYAADDVFTTTPPNADLANYAALSGRTPVLASHSEIPQMPLQKILWLGESRMIAALRSDESLAAFGLQGVQTEERIYEFMPQETTKAEALGILAGHLGLTQENVVAFGDGENDIPMFEWAGLSFAMPHGWKNALAKATRVAPAGSPHTALARAVDEFLCGS